MREWNLKSGDPLVLTLAADARLCQTSYGNDQIWELSLGSGDPHALALQTTYGLRARSMRMFPRFIEGDEVQVDTNALFSPPVVHICLPNLIRLSFSPFSDIDVQMEIWVPSSQSICGKTSIRNSGSRNRNIQLDWIGQLNPGEGQRMAPVEMESTPVLTGHTANIFPLILLTNSPRHGSGSYPTLSLALNLAPGEEKNFTWIHTALESIEASFKAAQELATCRWEAEMARIEMVNASQVEVYSGDEEWDAAFMLAQKVALGCFQSATNHLAQASIVRNRLPEQGYSLRGDGVDYTLYWNGQSVIDVWYQANLASLAAPELVKGLLQNFLDIQTEDGFIDWKPGLAGQRSRVLATPLLSTMTLRLDDVLDDRLFLQDAFPRLLKYFQFWFNQQNDRDQDGLPEWSHPLQTGQEDHLVYSHWNPWSQGVDISKTESPVLGAFLYKECLSLMEIGRRLGRVEALQELKAYAEKLRQAVESTWNPDLPGYLDRDRDTHVHPMGELLGQTSGESEIQIQRAFSQPVRLLFHIFPGQVSRPSPTIYVHGYNSAGNHRVEKIGAETFKWSPERGVLTGELVYQAIEQIEIRDFNPDDQLFVYRMGLSHQDQTQFAPLWAGIPDEERATELVERSLSNNETFWKAFGIAACSHPHSDEETSICRSIYPVWTQIIAEGLLNYGFRHKTAELVTHLMEAILSGLKKEQKFHEYYDSRTGRGFGKDNALTGLAPLGLFLDSLGVRFLSGGRVAIAGLNPYPWPVTVKYRGVSVVRLRESTQIHYPDGQSVEVTDPAPRIIMVR